MKRIDERDLMVLLAGIANAADDLIGLVACYGIDNDDEAFNDLIITLAKCYTDYCNFIMDVVFEDVNNN